MADILSIRTATSVIIPEVKTVKKSKTPAMPAYVVWSVADLEPGEVVLCVNTANGEAVVKSTKNGPPKGKCTKSEAQAKYQQITGVAASAEVI